MLKQWLYGVLLVGLSVLAHAKAPEKIHYVEGISEYRLKNGLQVLLFPDPTKETVTVNVTYKVGSKHENYGETGMAHLLEHLMFKGSKKHKDIPAELSAHGARPNGTTWIDRTNYFETFAATEENIDWALSLESDRMVNSFIARKDLDSEMTVVRNEFESGENSPFRVLMSSVMQAAYDWHNNGKPTIGARSDIENVSIDRLQAFYRKYYQPDNAVLVVAGKFNEADLLKKIQKTFGKIKKPKRALPSMYTEEPPADGETRVTIRRVGDVQLYASAYRIPAGTHPDYPALEALTLILGDTPRGRLHRSVTEQKLAVSSFAFPFQLEDPGLMFFAAQADLQTDLAATQAAMITTIEGIAQSPITDEELETAKLSWMKQFEQAYNSPEKIAVMLSEYIGMGDWRLLFLTRDRVESLTVEDVQRVAKQYLTRNNRTDGVFVPTENPERIAIPAAPSVAEQLKGYEGKATQAFGEAFDPSFSNIAARTEVKTLSSGAKVALLEKKSRGQEVVVQFAFQFGNANNLKGERVAAELLPAMFMLGTKDYSRSELVTAFDKIKTVVNISGDVNSLHGSLTTDRAHVQPALELLAHVLTEPAFDAKEFDLLKSRNVAQLEAGRQDPNAIVSRESARLFNDFERDHPLYVPALEARIEEIKAVALTDVKSLYQTFYGASHMQVAVVGDFDSEAVVKTLERTLGGWRSKPDYAPIYATYQSFEPVVKTFETPDKENAILLAKMLIPVGENDPQAAALEMGLYMLGGGFLNSRIATRLRQQEGLSYGAGAWVSLSGETSRGTIGAYAIFAPQNLGAVELALREVIDQVVEDGFTSEELEEAKKGYLQGKRVDRTQAHTMAGFLNAALYLDRDLLWWEAFESAIRALTVEQVNAVIKQTLRFEDLSLLKAGDFANAKHKASTSP